MSRPSRAPSAAGVERIIISAIEHDAVTEHRPRPQVRKMGAFAGSRSCRSMAMAPADLTWLAQALEGPGKTLVRLMLANNETGVIQPVAEASKLGPRRRRLAACRRGAGGRQDRRRLRVGSGRRHPGALSAHKLGGPQGVGALARRDPRHGHPSPPARRRPGAAVAGPGGWHRERGGHRRLRRAAAKAATESLASLAEQAHWRDALARRVRAHGAVVLGEGADARRPTAATPCFKPARASVSDGPGHEPDLAGAMASAGSACSSGKVKASRVVEAMGRTDPGCRSPCGSAAAGPALGRRLIGWRRRLARRLEAYRSAAGEVA
ncbi:hypothetical protein ACRAWD_00215 [Caulobacter segnis]